MGFGFRFVFFSGEIAKQTKERYGFDFEFSEVENNQCCVQFVREH